MDDREADPVVGQGALADVRTDADAVVSHRHLDGPGERVELQLERPLGALVGVEHDVLGGLGGGRPEVLAGQRVEAEELRQPEDRPFGDRDVLHPVGHAQPDVGDLAGVAQSVSASSRCPSRPGGRWRSAGDTVAR